MGDGGPTIKDVAERAGVSKSLVSLVLQDSPKVSARSRGAVMKAAADLGYRRNRVARSLVLRRTNIIGLVISDLHNPFYADVTEAVQAAAELGGYQALVGSSGLAPRREAELADAFLELRTDGVLLISPVLGLGEMERIARGAPTVVIGRHDPHEAGIDSVVNDDAHGAELAVEHLADLGHRRIAHITGGQGAGASERRTGYERAMRRRGRARWVQIEEGEVTERGGYEGALRLLSAGLQPTAILAGNDLAAVGVLQAIEETGRSVPGDISVVGYDNTHLAGLRRFSLTSVEQPRHELGRLAVQMLVGRIDGARAPAVLNVLTPSLVVRESTGPPPG